MPDYRYVVADLKTCAVEGCDRPVHGRGWCGTHYARWRRTGDPGDATPQRVIAYADGARCSIDGCDRRPRARGMCTLHHRRTVATGDAGPAGRVRGDDGAGSIVNGYRRIQRGGVTKMEHVWVMEEALGRELSPDENVHHINGDRLDNRLDNLELWSTSQPPGQRVEDKVAWARMILARYGRDVDAGL